MLRYFRINDPYRLLGLLAILVIIYLPLFLDMPAMTYPELKSIIIGEKIQQGHGLYSQLVDSTAPLAAWFNGFIDLLFGRSLVARHILAFFVLFFQASFVGIMFADKKAFSENTYIPSLIFSILFFFSFDTLSLTPELLGAGFILLALDNLFKEIEFREQRNESIFNLGLYIGLGSLFSFSLYIYLPAALLILIIFTRHPPRKYFLLVSGFLIPHLLFVSVFYLKDASREMWEYYYLPNLSFSSTWYISSSSLWWLGGLPLLFLVISLVMLNREARFTKYQTQLVQSMFFWMIFSFAHIFFSKDVRPQSLITLLPSFSFFITHALLLIHKKKFAEIGLWVLMGTTVCMSYLTRYDNFGAIDYSKLIVENDRKIAKDKKVLVLDENWGVYKNNAFASPFLDWQLSKEIFKGPDYYENVIKVYQGLTNDPPDVIRDKEDLLKPFLERIPELKREYVREGIYYNKRPASN
ncbi:MAG TPA: DUF6427 family protein [Chryseolinea sp.]|nr:DUF6427 family protein [Chryseolinea sp.]